MGQLVETEKKEMSGDVACLDVGPVPEGASAAGSWLLAAMTIR